MRRLLIAAASFAVLASASAFELPNAWQNARAIDAAGIEAQIVGNHLEGGYRAHNYRFFVGEGGELLGQLGLTGSDNGRWWLRGDDFCYEWSHYFAGVPRCYRMLRDGDHVVMQSVDAYRIAPVYARLAQGRPDGY